MRAIFGSNKIWWTVWLGWFLIVGTFVRFRDDGSWAFAAVFFIWLAVSVYIYYGKANYDLKRQKH